jgi:DNA repair exonuclease SbcCD ATPase subunit
MAGEVVRLKEEISKINGAYVILSCEYRESKTALQAKIKALEADLDVSKKTCKEQEYLLNQAREKGAVGVVGVVGAVGAVSGVGGAGAELERTTAMLEWKRAELAENRLELEAARARIAELEEKERETAVSRKRMRELEVAEASWRHLRGVLLTRP